MLSSLDTNPNLTLKDIAKSINQKRLFTKLNVSLEAGQALRISGSNGSGKSTLLSILSGLTDADKGTVLWQGEPINSSTRYQADCCYIGHRNAIKAQLNTSENISFYQKLFRLPKRDINHLLLQLGLLEHADTLVKHLSFGQQRRLALSRLLLSKAKLWLLDEPYTGIDDEGRLFVDNLCLQHLQSGGLLVLSHHGRLTSPLSDKITQHLVL